MYSIQLPENLRKYVRKSVLKRIAVLVALEVLVAAVLYMWGETLFHSLNREIRISFCVLLLLLPFLISGVPFKMLDTSYRGTVVKVKVETTVDNASAAKPTREYLYQKNTVLLLIRRDDGESILKKVYEGKADRQEILETYKEGDEVFHLYGTKHIISVPEAADTQVCCAVCGNTNSTENETCRKCGYVLIKS